MHAIIYPVYRYVDIDIYIYIYIYISGLFAAIAAKKPGQVCKKQNIMNLV